MCSLWECSSRGSVIPLFKQIKEGKDITITHPNDKIPNVIIKSNDLVGILSKLQNGDIFIHKAKSSYVLDIANMLKNYKIKK